MEGPKNDHFGQKKKKKKLGGCVIFTKVQKMTIFGEKKKTGGCVIFTKVEKWTFWEKKKKKKVSGVEGPKNEAAIGVKDQDSDWAEFKSAIVKAN